MPRNIYPNKPIDELKRIREAILSARRGGSTTHVGISPGIYHEFQGKSFAELDRSLDEVDYSLYLAAKADGDADLIAAWPNPYTQKNMRVISAYPGSLC